MRILYVHHTLPPDSFAGSEIYHDGLARAMARRNEVAFLYRESDPRLPECFVRVREPARPRIYALNNTFRDCDSFELTYRNPAIERRFAELLEEVQPEVVHFGHLTCLSTSLPGIARRRGACVFMTLHDFWLLCQRGQLLRRDYALCDGPSAAGCALCLADQIALSPRAKQASRLAGRYLRFAESRALRRLAYWYSIVHMRLNRSARSAIETRTAAVQEVFETVDGFISPSRFLRDRYIQSGVPAEKIVASQNGLSKSFLSSYRRTASSRLRIGYIGSIIPSKGLHILLEAVERFSADRLMLTVHGAFQPYHGDASYEGRLRPMLEKPNVRYAGPFERSALGSILSEIDVLVVPSTWYENAPVTIQEAFEAGIPVIAADHGGMRESVTDGTDGLLFAPGSATDLARVIGRLAADRSLVEKLSRGTRPQKSVEENVEELERLYAGCLARRHAPGRADDSRRP